MDWEVRESAPAWPGPIRSDTAREGKGTWIGKLGNQHQLGLVQFGLTQQERKKALGLGS